MPSYLHWEASAQVSLPYRGPCALQALRLSGWGEEKASQMPQCLGGTPLLGLPKDVGGVHSSTNDTAA